VLPLEGSSLQIELERTARNLGADLFGVADLAIAHDFISSQGGEYLGKFPRAISIGVRLLDAVVDGLHQHEDLGILFAYRGLYNSVNSLLDQIALILAKKIQDKGYQAFPIPASHTIDPNKMIGAISHKLPASLSGMGWIGKNCLLITPDYGPRVRLATILTDAPLETGHPIADNCGDCRDCVEVCPVKALKGVQFNPSEPREVRFNAQLCRDYTEKRKQRMGEGLCGLCLYICPYGRADRKNGG